MCLWFPGSTKDDNLAICKTFNSVFSNMTIWKGPHGWGFFLFGTLKKTYIDTAKVEQAFANPLIVKDLSEYDNVCVTSKQLMALYAMSDGNDLVQLTKNAPIITDNYPYTEFPLWRNLLRSENENAR
jgi:hypothetical protein